MKTNELKQVGAASQDPAVTFILLLPLAVIHISGWQQARSGAFSVVEQGLRWLGQPAYWCLGLIICLALLWAIGRIRLNALAWRGGASLIIAEGIVWGILLGPLLDWLSRLVPSQPSALWLFNFGTDSSIHGSLALAAGAGLYEELIFRAGILGGLFVLLRGLFLTVGWRASGAVLAMGISLILSSAMFAWAHTLGDPAATTAPVMIYRFLAGVLLGGLFSWRGLAVVAWAHASYDALLLL